MTTIPQTDPRAGYLEHKVELDNAMTAVLERGCYIIGSEVANFEKEFAHYLGVLATVGVANGTDAIELALRALGIGPGDTVATVSHTAVATVAAIERCGALPVFVDIDPGTYNMDPNRLESLLKNPGAIPRPKAVVAVHLYGGAADVLALAQLCQQYGCFLVEDCAQAHGALLQGRRLGTWGDVAAFSFYPTKNLGAFGDGGAVVAADPSLVERVRLLREYGWRRRYISEIVGVNSRLDELQAAILRIKLLHLDRDNERRRAIAERYDQSLLGFIGQPKVLSDAVSVYHQYVIRSQYRDALQQHLTAGGVSTLIHYPIPVHLQPAYQERLRYSDLTHTETAAREVLSLPMYPQLGAEAVERVNATIRKWSDKSKK